MRVLLGVLALLITSPIDFPLMLIGGEWLPHWPTAWESAGSWYHHAKGFWASLYRADGEWWSKFSRFVIWWLTFFIIWR